MISCPSCDRHLPSAALNCPCGWQKSMRGPVPHMPLATGVPLPTREESLAAWMRQKEKIEAFACEFAHPGNWTREEWIKHWLKVQTAPKSLYAARCSEEALHNLGHRP
jgi:hypothetical protein